MSYIKIRWAKNGNVLANDVRKVNIIGPGVIIDNGNGNIEFDTNIEMGEISNVDLSSLPNNAKLLYDNSLETWFAVEDSPPSPPGSQAVAQTVLKTIDPISGTVSIPRTTSPPTVTQGLEFLTQTITTITPNPLITVSGSFTLSTTNNNTEVVVTIFRDSTLIGSTVSGTTEANSGVTVAFSFSDDGLTGPGDVAIYSCRIGKINGPGSWYINTLADLPNAFGDSLRESVVVIQEWREVT